MDILIKGKEEMPYDKLEIIKFFFDKSDLPFVVNFIDFHSTDEKFYKMIEKDLVKI